MDKTVLNAEAIILLHKDWIIVELFLSFTNKVEGLLYGMASSLGPVEIRGVKNTQDELICC